LPKSNLRQAGISEKEIQMALSLVEGMTDDWDASRYHDTYREDVLEMVQKKIKANQTKTVTEPREDGDGKPTTAQIIDLMELLKRSVSSKGGAPARKAARPRKTDARSAAKSATKAPARKSAAKTRAPASSPARAKPSGSPRRVRA
jgi:DNA end-binding protein Ku